MPPSPHPPPATRYPLPPAHLLTTGVRSRRLPHSPPPHHQEQSILVLSVGSGVIEQPSHAPHTPAAPPIGRGLLPDTHIVLMTSSLAERVVRAERLQSVISRLGQPPATAPAGAVADFADGQQMKDGAVQPAARVIGGCGDSFPTGGILMQALH